jgi:hypothetical protein
MSADSAEDFSSDFSASSPENRPHSELLDQVLKWTSHPNDEQLLNQALQAAQDQSKLRQTLLEICRRYQGNTVSLEEFCFQLVKTILLHDFHGVRESWNLEATSREVAKTIVALPNSRNRMEQLWRRLSEALQ